MKILYALQGTGNGHVCRAQDIVPALQAYAKVDVLISGIQADLDLPFPVQYRHKGLSFIFGRKGGVDLWKTFRKANLRRLWNEVKQVPVEDYDLVINDFEPVTAWACFFRQKACISLSHQNTVLAPEAPKPISTDYKGYLTLKYYAPCTQSYGFHFLPYSNRIFTPVIRKQVREANKRTDDHITVYLPGYSHEKLVSLFTRFPNFRWEIFSKHSLKSYRQGSIFVQPIHNDAFIRSMASSRGVICGAGFETPAETLYLGKKLMVVPMKNQFEQHCNAAALDDLGVPVLKNLKKKRIPLFEAWLQNEEAIHMDYPDHLQLIVSSVLCHAEKILQEQIKKPEQLWKELILSSF